MRFLLVGEGAEESAWVEAIRARPDHELLAVWPPLSNPEASPERTPTDLDDALVWPGIEAVIVGGPATFRDEALRKVAAVGLHAIALHPPGPNADAYYQVALSRAETGSIVVPDLPLRHHPAIVGLKAAIDDGRLQAPLDVVLDLTVPQGEGDLVAGVFSRWADIVRYLLGEVTSISAFGEPPGQFPSRSLTAQLRIGETRRAEVRIHRGEQPSARFTVSGPLGNVVEVIDLSAPTGLDWAPHSAILKAFAEAVSGGNGRPNLLDGTRAMELAEGVGRSLRRNRAVDLHYEQVSEANNFKSVMTSLGCMILMCTLVALPLSLAGPALGIGWLLYISYAIPPILILFALLQILKFGVKPAEVAGPKQALDVDRGAESV